MHAFVLPSPPRSPPTPTPAPPPVGALVPFRFPLRFPPPRLRLPVFAAAVAPPPEPSPTPYPKPCSASPSPGPYPKIACRDPLPAGTSYTRLTKSGHPCPTTAISDIRLTRPRHPAQLPAYSKALRTSAGDTLHGPVLAFSLTGPEPSSRTSRPSCLAIHRLPQPQGPQSSAAIRCPARNAAIGATPSPSHGPPADAEAAAASPPNPAYASRAASIACRSCCWA